MLYKILTLVSLFALAILLNFLAQFLQHNTRPLNTAEIVKNFTAEKQEKIIVSAEKEPPVEILLDAKAVCVFDVVKDRFLFKMNAGTQMPLASLAKLMTALIAKEHFLNTALVEITKEAILQEGDSGLRIGEMWKLPRFLEIMLISSSNDAAFAIASTIKNGLEPNDFEFVKLMNQKAQFLGLKQTYFSNSTGLDISETEAGAFGSCEDINVLMRYLMKNHLDLMEATSKEKLESGGRIFKNTNELLSKLPFFIGGKTGFSDLAGGNLTVAVDKGLNHPIIITVLGSTERGRFKDVEILYNKYVK